MINLFEHFDLKTERLYKTLQLAGHDNQTIVLNDNGFLPDNIMSPYQYFAENKITASDKPKFFNEIEVPQYWVIEGTNDSAEIKDMGKVRGKIFYQPNYKARVVNRVEWLDEDGQVRFVDYYTKHGIKYAQTVYDKRGVAIFKKYMNRDGKEVIYENYVTKDIVLDWKGKSHFFDSEVGFIMFFIKTLNIEMQNFVINSLATSFAVLYNLTTPGNDILFWQEDSRGNIPGNMRLILEKAMQRHIMIHIPEQKEYESITSQLTSVERKQVIDSGYLYKYKKKNNYTKQALIMTNSDQIDNIEVFISECPDVTFHIAAITEMSTKLMNLSRYPNIKLYPTADSDTVERLYQICDLYLDINEGKEILGALNKAFENELLIMGYESIAHNRVVTATENLFNKENVTDSFIKVFTKIVKNKTTFDKHLKAQKTHANEVSKQYFNQQLFKR
ncbi:accessory Sec system glycosylation chaperone GtfB [Staphylococcus sp. ACRSN]|uniref:accessory Sec system glycosylation chaperone GtfB n=1 Tax=Staphylococcus sp. ACRSN TaxID=2918214 RepID=UPI001EF30769|nr:accessory Sec system glycosylation chaperone GtfB [Staphylococcus sp. ACRSN]MCG7339008.1 accessory Sec system glycosylation chaperone GtfB [Staphylococcus sp. ACRSN]